MNGRQVQRGSIGVAGAALVVVSAGLAVHATSGFPNYRAEGWWGCEEAGCHEDFSNHVGFQGRIFPNGGKHGMHRNPDAMNTECTLCHTTYGDNPSTFSSAGTATTPGYGCAGCHGRDYGGDVGVRGIGLRVRHFNAGIEVCSYCHELWDVEPLPENVPPPYHGSYDTRAWDSCNQAPWYGENFSLETDTHFGLDNDGDGLYDTDDPDCAEADPCPCDCQEDKDGAVGVGDFLALLGQWGTNPGSPCDLDGSGVVDVSDFLDLLANWGPCPE
jgi:hypothetical protein